MTFSWLNLAIVACVSALTSTIVTILLMPRAKVYDRGHITIHQSTRPSERPTPRPPGYRR